MHRSTSSVSLLNLLLPQWHDLLQGWALDGSISRAAQDALQLDGEPALYSELISQWAAGEFSGLPAVELLPAASMAGAAGAYALSTGTIYLNADWLTSATPRQAFAVLSEELGHHLDGLLNASDTPGDEGELFATLLQGDGVTSTEQREQLLNENDLGSAVVNGEALAVEQATVISTPIPAASPGRTLGEVSNQGAFAALRADGSVVTWGSSSDGGDSSAVAGQLSSGVSQIFSTGGAFAALKDDGSVVTWGKSWQGGDSSWVADRLSSGVSQIFSTGSAFAALKDDGSVVTWPGFSGVDDRLSSGVTRIFSGRGAFAALKDDGSVVTWGGWDGGDSSAVADQLSSGVLQVTPTYDGMTGSDSAFAALKADGSVVTWGGASTGGDSRAVADQLSSGVVRVFANGAAFAALKDDGSVVTWGSPDRGGDSSAVAGQLSSGVTQIIPSLFAFAALKDDGSVVSWGDSSWGADSSGVASQLRSDVEQIFSTSVAFAALKADGSVVTWEGQATGGDGSAVADQLSSGVTQIFSTFSAFAALKDDGSVVTWGVGHMGGDSSAVTGQLSSGVSQIFSTGSAFAALKADGSVVTWGSPDRGGDSSAVADQLTNVVAFANPFADDRLVVDALLPSISLAVSPASVTEDGSELLNFTFTRTGSTGSELTVNYTLEGTATLGTDYTGIATTPATKTVSFAAGSSTATVMVDPIADSESEPNETVELTLAAGSGYTIGTTAAVSGIISNKISIERFSFTYFYGNGDSYSGLGYAPAGTYSVGLLPGFYTNETGNQGYYIIDSVQEGETGIIDTIQVTSYTDADTGFGITTNIGDPNWGDGVHGYMGLGSEQGYAFSAAPWIGDYYFTYYSEADLRGVLQVRLNLLADNNGTPGEALANDVVGLNHSFFVQIQVGDFRGNAAGVIGINLDLAWNGLILESINFDQSLNITTNFPLFQDGTLLSGGGLTESIDDLSGGSLPAFDIGQAIGVNQLDTFALLRFRADDLSQDLTYFTTTLNDASFADDAPNYTLDIETFQALQVLTAYSQYNFTYYYGNGDSYSGYVYATEGTYSIGQELVGYPNEIGYEGYYRIDSIAATVFDGNLNNQVYVTSYTDGDTGFGATTNIGEDWWTADGIHGYSGLGSESGYAYAADGNSSDPLFSNNYEADILNQYYTFTYTYGNGDSYNGYGYALAGTYVAGQTLEGYNNETGNSGFYTITSVDTGTANPSLHGHVYVISYTDADTGFGETTNISKHWWGGNGSSGLGSEEGSAYDSIGNSSDAYFNSYYEADILGNQLYNFTYYYGNGDSYTGYGYAAVGTYTAGQVIDGFSNETGFGGFYVIESIELGNTNAGYNGYVYVTSYNDADSSFGTTTNLYNYGNSATYSGLGNEASYAYDADGNSSDAYFNNYYEADILNQYYTFTYTYGNGDSYNGYGYALAGTYVAGQTLEGYSNETGNAGYYTINSVEAGTTSSSDNNRVYVTSYTDGDTLYGETTNLSSYGQSSGLGSEEGYAYTSDGSYQDAYFSNFYEADLVYAGFSITDNSGNANDSTIKFTTQFPWRPNYAESDFVRPSFADSTKYFDVTNTGTGVLEILDVVSTIAGVQVVTNLVGDLLINPGDSQRIQLTYQPSAAAEDFAVADGLILFTNDLTRPEHRIALSGKSTYNADINYDGTVGIGDLGPLNNAFRNFKAGIYDPTADINGDGTIGIGDLSGLNNERGLSLI